MAPCHILTVVANSKNENKETEKILFFRHV